MLEYIIIGLLVLVIILLIILLVRRSNNTELVERIGHFEANINKEIGEFKFTFSKDLMTDFEKFVCTTLENKEKNKKIRMQRELMAEKNSRNIQPEKLSDSSYKKLLRECQNDFKKGILELKRDKASKENFIKILDDIRNKVENYFSD